MTAFRVTPLDIARALQGADANVQAGAFSRQDRDVRIEAGRFLASRKDVESLVIGVSTERSVSGTGPGNVRPVYLKDVAEVMDGPGEVTSYVRFSAGPAWAHGKEADAAGHWADADARAPQPPPIAQPAVTLAIAKQKGSNNVRVAEDILSR
jgi:multidrug efflux pump subunit AcrB